VASGEEEEGEKTHIVEAKIATEVLSIQKVHPM
jgi:hypothetical protein